MANSIVSVSKKQFIEVINGKNKQQQKPQMMTFKTLTIIDLF